MQDENSVREEDRSISLKKFGEKLLVWQVICSCGERTQSFITKGTINTQIYINECLKKRLIPFEKTHQNNLLFWPDLATAHYARETQEFLNSKNITFVAKDMNPSNCPQLRPIEKYWALMKTQLRKYCPSAISDEDFKRKWLKFSKNISCDIVQNLMGSIKKKFVSLAEKI